MKLKHRTKYKTKHCKVKQESPNTDTETHIGDIQMVGNAETATSAKAKDTLVCADVLTSPISH